MRALVLPERARRDFVHPADAPTRKAACLPHLFEESRSVVFGPFQGNISRWIFKSRKNALPAKGWWSRWAWSWQSRARTRVCKAPGIGAALNQHPRWKSEVRQTAGPVTRSLDGSSYVSSAASTEPIVKLLGT